MKSTSWKSILKLLVKLLLTAGAVYFVFRKIDVEELWLSLSRTNLWFFFLSFLFFNLSKIVSAFRQNRFYEPAGIRIETPYSLRLYYVGMFYNLFLPGSIGGDAYKVYLLKNRYREQTKTKLLIAATFLDRLSGLVLLFVLMCLFLLLSTFHFEPSWIYALTWLAMLAALPVYYLIIRWFFPSFKSLFLRSSHYSFWVQAGQAASALLLLHAVGIDSQYMDYLALFMASSVVAVLPFTIGGIGARELVFIYGCLLLHIDKETAVAFSFLFFAVTALSSLIGLWFVFRIDKRPEAATELKE